MDSKKKNTTRNSMPSPGSFQAWRPVAKMSFFSERENHVFFNQSYV